MRKAKNKSAIKISPELKRALDAFPKIVKEQERNFKKRERDIKRFDKLVKQLKKMRVGM